MGTAMHWRKGDYTLSDATADVPQDYVYAFLSQEAYWSKGALTREAFQRSIANALNFSMFKGDEPVGFARLVTDYSSIAYLADVFVSEQHRGEGLGKWLIKCITEYEALSEVRRWLLVTSTADSLYTKYGFEPLAQPEWFMQKTQS